MSATMDLAVLGLEVRSDGVVVASNRLDDLERSADSTTKATDRFKNELSQTQNQAQATTKTVGELSKAMQILGVSMSLAYAFKTLSDFEQSMSSVRAITRATGQDFDLLRNKAQELGASTRYTAAQAAESMRFLGQAGFTTNEILTASADVLSLAQSGALDLASAAEIAAKALRGFRLDVSEMSDVADLMAKAANVSNTNIRELGEAFTYVGPVATSFGISMQDTTAAIAALSDAGISSSMAGTSLRGMLTKLANPTRQAQQLLKEAGLSMDQLDVKTRGLIPVLEDLANSTIGVEQAMVIFGQRAGPGFEVLASSIDKMKRFSSEFRNIEGYAKETAQIMDDNLQGALLNFVSAIEDMALRTAESSGILDGMKVGLLGLAEVLRTITSIAIVPYLDNVVVGLGLYVAASKAAAIYTSATSGAIAYQITLFKMYVASATGAATATGALTMAFGALRGVMMALATNPLFWVVAAGSALYALYDTVKQGEQEMENLREAFRKTGDEADYISQKAKDAAAALREMQQETQVTAAQDSLKAATQTMDEVLGKFERAVGLATSARSATQSYERQIGSVSEAFWGLEEGTLAAGKAVRTMFAQIKQTDDITKQAQILNDTMRQLREIEKLNPKLESVQKAIKDVQALGGALKLVIDAADDLEKASQGVKKIGETGKEARREIEELDAALALINKKPVVPQTAAEAIEFLNKLVEGTDSYKQKQYEAQMETAKASLAILAQAQALAIAEGRMEDAVAILAKYVELQSMVANVKPPKASGSGDRSAENAARFQEAAATKLNELRIRYQQIQVEINGASAQELEVYKLRIEREKELADLKDKAAKAGRLGASEEIRQAQELVDQIYNLRIGLAEYNASWESTLKPLRDAVEITQAIGAGTEDVTRALKEQELLKAQGNTLIDEVERSRQVAILEAEIATLSREILTTTLETTSSIAEQTGHFTEMMQAQADIYDVQIAQLNAAKDMAQSDEQRASLNAQIADLMLQQREALAYAKNDWMELLTIGIQEKALDSQKAFLDIWKQDIPNAVSDVTSSFADLTIDLISSSKSASEAWSDFGTAVGNIFQNLAKTIMDAIMQALVFKAITSALGGTSFGAFFGLGAGVAHTGAKVGGNYAQTRMAPASLWTDAKRYHTGGMIGSDEEAIIAKKGEWVLTPEQLAAYKGNSSTNVTYNTNYTFNTKVEGGSSSGDAMADEALAERIGQQIQKQVEAVTRGELVKQSRPGGMLNSGLSGG